MSGVWGGWMRRLRRGQAAGADLAPAPADQDASGRVGGIEPGPSDEPELDGDASAADRQADDVEAPEAAGAPDEVDLDDGRWPKEDERDAGPASSASARSAVRPVQAEPAAAVPLRALLERGELAACRAAMGRQGQADLAPLVAALTEGEAVLRDLGMARDEDSVAVMLAPAPGARRLLIVFGQDGGGFHLSPGPDLGQVHTLYLRDDRHCLTMLGVERLGADYDSCLLGILRIARALGAADLFCLGGGAACYSALRYGLDLGAAGVLAAGNLDVVRRGVQAPGLHPGPQARRLMRLTADLGADIAQAYATAAVRPGLVLCRPGEAALAGLAALPGTAVTQAPPGAAARLLDWAEQGGQLRGMIGDLLSCRPVG